MPGSVFKLITTSAAIDSGTCTPNSSFNCTGHYTVVTQDYSCADNGFGVLGVHGWQNMGEVLKNSCNLATIQEAQLMGKDVFSDYYNAFGFTAPTGVDLPAEQQIRAGVILPRGGGNERGGPGVLELWAGAEGDPHPDDHRRERSGERRLPGTALHREPDPGQRGQPLWNRSPPAPSGR